MEVKEKKIDGWNLEDCDELNSLFDELADTRYEINNCVRGGLTNCKTYGELSRKLEEFAERMTDCASYLKYKKDEISD